jgi:hypothetical protein
LADLVIGNRFADAKIHDDGFPEQKGRNYDRIVTIHERFGCGRRGFVSRANGEQLVLMNRSISGQMVVC